MKKILIIAILFVFSLSFVVLANQQITLDDGSVIIGEIVEMRDGNYRIRSTTMGEINISANRISNISNAQTTQTAPTYEYEQQPSMYSSDNYSHQQDQVDARVRSMTMDGDFLDQLIDLSESNYMTQVMSDPEIMEAISRNDYDFLMNNEKMNQLMNSSEIKDLLGDF